MAPTQVLSNPRCFPAHAAHTGLRAFVHAAPLPGTFLPPPLLGSPLPPLPKDLPKSDGGALPEAHGAAPSQRSWLEYTWLVTSLTPASDCKRCVHFDHQFIPRPITQPGTHGPQ